MFDIDEIRKKMTRAEFINEGSCPSDYGLINRFDECSSISFHNCCKCREKAIKDIKFKDDDIELERKLMEKTLEEAMNREIKKYAGWEIAKMIAEKQLKDEMKFIWHGNLINNEITFNVYRGLLIHEDSKRMMEVQFLISNLDTGYFTIEKQYLTFIEAKRQGTPKHKDKGYSYQDYKVSEFINEMDKKVWYI